jgi:hypothetical protein
MRLRRVLAAGIGCLAFNAWAEPPLVIGELFAIPRPPGFSVEDARPEAMKAADRSVNVPPLDLLAEALIDANGEKLAGKKLVVQEFSITTQDKGHLVGLGNPVVASPAPVLGALAVAGGLIALKHLRDDGGRLEVRIVASLDGKTCEGTRSGDIPPKDDRGRVETIVHGAILSFMYRLSQGQTECGDASAAKGRELPR